MCVDRTLLLFFTDQKNFFMWILFKLRGFLVVSLWPNINHSFLKYHEGTVKYLLVQYYQHFICLYVSDFCL